MVWKKISLKKCGYVWLVGFIYVFGKNYGWGLCVAINMYKKFGLVVFGSVAALTFQSVFYLEIHQNNFFIIF